MLNGVGIDVPIHALDAVEKALAGEHHVLFSRTAALQNVLGKLAGDFDDRLQITTSPRQPPNAVRGQSPRCCPAPTKALATARPTLFPFALNLLHGVS